MCNFMLWKYEHLGYILFMLDGVVPWMFGIHHMEILDDKIGQLNMRVDSRCISAFLQIPEGTMSCTRAC